VIEDLRRFEVEGFRMLEVLTTFLWVEPDEMGGVLYACEDLLRDGYSPQEGDTIKGRLWFHGSLLSGS
jgi:hypothetical protein